MLWLKKVKADEDQGGYFMVKKLVVCCLDILGYSRKVECSKDDEFFMENLHEMIRELEEEIKKSEENKSCLKIQTFSDSIFLFCEPKDFAVLLHYVSVFIFRVFKYGINLKQPRKDDDSKDGNIVQNEYTLVRGGISYGNIHIKKGEVFWGKAIIEAHEMESAIAIYPRIVLHSSIMEMLEEQKDEIKDFVDIKNSILDDFDFPYFNSLKFLSVKTGKDEVKNIIEDTKNLQKIVENEKNSKVRQKYLWLMRYFERIYSS